MEPGRGEIAVCKRKKEHPSSWGQVWRDTQKGEESSITKGGLSHRRVRKTNNQSGEEDIEGQSSRTHFLEGEGGQYQV